MFCFKLTKNSDLNYKLLLLSTNIYRKIYMKSRKLVINNSKHVLYYTKEGGEVFTKFNLVIVHQIHYY